jgi:hypothetical protein
MTIVFLLYLSRPVLSSPFNFILHILFYSYSSFLPYAALHCTAVQYFDTTVCQHFFKKIPLFNSISALPSLESS